MARVVKHDLALRKFRTHLETVEGYEPNTVAGYVSAVRQFLLWYGRQRKNWAELTIAEAAAYWSGCRSRYAPTTANHHLKALRSFYKFGEQIGYVVGNPWHHCRRATGESAKRNILSFDDIERVKAYDPGDDWFGRRDRAIVLFLLSTGMRIAACTRVDVADVDLAHYRVRCRDKGHRWHWKALVSPAREAVEEWIDLLRPLRARPGEPALWVSRFGQRIDQAAIRDALARVCMACGIRARVTPHDLRRTVGTLMRRMGVPKEDIQQFYGHKRLQTTELYIYENEEAGLAVAQASHPLMTR